MSTVKEIDLRVMARHYVIAALWVDSPEGTCPQATRQAFDYALKQCDQFSAFIVRTGLHHTLLQRPEYWAHPDCMGKLEAALGHDLYLTSVGAGVGFWDRDALAEGELGDILTSYVKAWVKHPDVECYRGWMYIR